jgi:hypothetical protein
MGMLLSTSSSSPPRIAKLIMHRDVNISLDKVRNEPPNVWQSFSKFHAKSDGFMIFMRIILVT